jgi:hypothetical protein
MSELNACMHACFARWLSASVNFCRQEYDYHCQTHSRTGSVAGRGPFKYRPRVSTFERYQPWRHVINVPRLDACCAMVPGHSCVCCLCCLIRPDYSNAATHLLLDARAAKADKYKADQGRSLFNLAVLHLDQEQWQEAKVCVCWMCLEKNVKVFRPLVGCCLVQICILLLFVKLHQVPLLFLLMVAEIFFGRQTDCC